MTPAEVKKAATKAAKVGDKAAALDVCKAIHEGDLFIGVRPEKTPFTKTIKAEYDQRCQSCGQLARKGAQVLWHKGVGIYHPECAAA